MASDNLNEVGIYIKGVGRRSDLASKRVHIKRPIRDRARDTISSSHSFRMDFISDGTNTVLMDIDLNKPPPVECGAGCIATACESFPLLRGDHSLTLENPYEPNTVTVWSQGEA